MRKYFLGSRDCVLGKCHYDCSAAALCINTLPYCYPRSFQFNISIDDYPEIVEDTKRALNLVSGDSIIQRFPLSIEISLRTTEGDSMVLEVWSLGLATDRIDTNVRASHTIYNRMSILLKSLISVSRVTPAYKLSRRQSADSYQILYRIYVGDPESHCLGECELELEKKLMCRLCYHES